MKKNGLNVIHAPGDADVHIVKAAVASSYHQSTTLIGEDTDLLVLLLHYVCADSKELYFRSDNASRNTKVYNINQLKVSLGEELCSQLLFLHAFTGCDSTSRVFGIGKRTAFQKLAKGESTIKTCAKTFIVPNQPRDTVVENGTNAMVELFGGNSCDSLAKLRYNLFVKKLASAKSFVTPERLPPTASSTRYHSLRVYYQVMVWMGSEGDLNATDWGWRLEDDKLVPVMSDKDAAPENLLKMIRCNCTTGCRTGRCSCRGYGLPCHSGCGSCQVDACENPYNKSVAEEEEEA